jgi:hypothetical protein
LFIQETIQVSFFLQEPGGGFGSQVDFISAAVSRKVFSQEEFTGSTLGGAPAMVGIGRVQVIYSLVQGMIQ